MELAEWTRALAEESSMGAVIVVEGRRDEEALRALGVEGDFEYASRLLALLRCTPSYASGREFIILTDLDSEGEKLAMALKREIEQSGGRAETRLRGEYMRIPGRPPRIEELASAVLNEKEARRARWKARQAHKH